MTLKLKITTKNLILLITIVTILGILYSRSTEIDDYLPPIENHRQSYGRHIYFHHTSCNGDLDVHHSCMVESAARSHRGWQINIMVSAPTNGIQRWIKHFQLFRNVKFWRIHIDKYLHNTPMEYLVTERSLQTSNDSLTLTREVVRYVTLYKVSEYS